MERHLIFEEKFDVLKIWNKKTRLFWIENLINIVSQNYIYIYIYIPYFVRIYNRNTSHFYLYSIRLFANTFNVCSPSRYDSFCVPPCTRSNRWILIVLPYLAPPSLSLPSCPLFAVCTPFDRISPIEDFCAVSRIKFLFFIPFYYLVITPPYPPPPPWYNALR